MKIRNYNILILFVLAFAAAAANAQQTIFNVPSSDVLDKGKVYVELDAAFKPFEQNGAGKFSSFTPRVVAGAGRNVEIGFNLTGNIQPGSDSTTLVPAIKWRVYDGEKNGVQIVVGDSLYIPVRNRSYRLGNYAYAQISKTFKTRTRVTAGGYYFTKSVVSTAARGGGQFGFEQPITDKFGVVADYYTGRHSAGYFTPGINFKPHPKVTGYVGYSIGNDNPRTNNFFYAAIGVNLN